MTLVTSRCPVCGTPGRACTTPLAGGATPVDLPEGGSTVSGELREYDVTVRGNKTRLQLSEEDAKTFGVLEGRDASRKPGPDDPSAMEDQGARVAFGADEQPAKAKAPLNKARTASSSKE